MIRCAHCETDHQYYKDTLLIRDQRRITKKYLQSWFAIDFLSVAPGYIDLVSGCQ